MRIALVILILGLASSWAVEELNSFEDVEIPGEVKDEDLTEEQRHFKKTTAPSFEHIKKKLQEMGTLDHPNIVG